MNRDHQIPLCYSYLLPCGKEQISINNRARPESYLLYKHVFRTKTNIFAFTCCVHLCYLDSEIMSTANTVDRPTDSKPINCVFWLQ